MARMKQLKPEEFDAPVRALGEMGEAATDQRGIEGDNALRIMPSLRAKMPA